MEHVARKTFKSNGELWRIMKILRFFVSKGYSILKSEKNNKKTHQPHLLAVWVWLKSWKFIKHDSWVFSLGKTMYIFKCWWYLKKNVVHVSVCTFLGIYSIRHHICNEAVLPGFILHTGCKRRLGSCICTSPDIRVSWILWGKWGTRVSTSSVVVDTVTAVFRLWKFNDILPGNIYFC